MIIARKHSRVNASDDKFFIVDGTTSKSTAAVGSSNTDIQLPVLSINSDGTNLVEVVNESVDYLISLPEFNHSTVKISNTYYETNDAFINVLNNGADLVTPKHEFVIQAPCSSLYKSDFTFAENDIVTTEVHIASKERQDFLVFRIYKNNEFLAQYPSDNPTNPTETLETTKPLMIIVGTKLNGTSENIGYKIASYHYGSYEIANGNNNNANKVFGFYPNTSIERGKLSESGTFYNLMTYKMTEWNPIYPIVTNNRSVTDAGFDDVNDNIEELSDAVAALGADYDHMRDIFVSR